MARKDKDKEKNKEEQVNETVNSDTDENGSPEKETVTEEQSPEEKYGVLHDKYIRLYSDFDNFRKRSIKEKADIISSASGDVIKDLLEVLDDFERAIDNNEKVEDNEALREGFKLIFHKFKHVLENKGLEPMNAKGEVFDADKHEAITNIPVEKDEDKGKVVDVIERGYNLKGKPLRYAKVVVGQ